MDEADLFKALADPTRLKILEFLRQGEKCICEIIPYTGKSQPNVSQHLKVLKTTGLVDERREGTRLLLKASTKKIYDVIDAAQKVRVVLV